MFRSKGSKHCIPEAPCWFHTFALAVTLDSMPFPPLLPKSYLSSRAGSRPASTREPTVIIPSLEFPQPFLVINISWGVECFPTEQVSQRLGPVSLAGGMRVGGRRQCWEGRRS